jgi:dTMP kinase
MKFDGTLISFEGIEGCGKTTQIQLTSQALTQAGYQVLCLREPGGTKFGEKLRKAILESEEALCPTAEAMLFASSRAQLIEQIILPNLQHERQIVILDRFIDSSFVYQGIARKMGIEQIEKIHSISPLTIRPSVTFYLKINFAQSLERQRLRNNQKDYFEKENEDFYKNLIAGFDQLTHMYPKRIIPINGDQAPEAIHKQIMQAIQHRLPSSKSES